MHRAGRKGGWRWATLLGLVVCGGAHAHDGEETEIPDVEVKGALGNLIPWHKDAIHISLVWPENRRPQLCFWMRPSEWRGTALVSPVPPIGELRTDFRDFVFGGYNFSATLENSVRTRILNDLELENTLCADYPAALIATGKHHLEDLTQADFDANRAFFHDAGHSRGLNYNLFCAGNVMLADGRIAVIGGHDKAGNHGIRKINIYDPETGRWLPRPVPNTVSTFEAYLADPSVPLPSELSGLFERNTDPEHPDCLTEPKGPGCVDMKYQRWYPTAITLPNEQVLILSGSDQVSEVGPGAANATKVRHPTPEVYDPATDKNVALENARKFQPMYVRGFAIQTGLLKDEWKVMTVGEVIDPTPDDITGYDPFDYDGRTYLFDVQKALSDPRRGQVCDTGVAPAAPNGCKHWEFIGNAGSAHDSGAAVNLRFLDKRGLPVLQKVIAFGGADVNGNTTLIESLSFHLGPRGVTTPGWKAEPGRLPLAVDQNNAVVLPDGKVVVFGGGAGGRPRVANLDVQLFDPATGLAPVVATMRVPRHDHSNGTLLPDGTVLISGGNRVDLLAPPNQDLAVPAAQLYSPPYLFKGPRPVVTSAPKRIEYGRKFELRVSGTISQVSMLRMGPTTHNWSWGNEYVQLSFEQEGDVVKVFAPMVPGAAIPGPYQLFVLNADGVPSLATRVMVGEPEVGHSPGGPR